MRAFCPDLLDGTHPMLMVKRILLTDTSDGKSLPASTRDCTFGQHSGRSCGPGAETKRARNRLRMQPTRRAAWRGEHKHDTPRLGLRTHSHFVWFLHTQDRNHGSEPEDFCHRLRLLEEPPIVAVANYAPILRDPIKWL